MAISLMKVKSGLKVFFNFIRTNILGLQSLIFFMMALINFNDFNKFWLFMAGGIIFDGLQSVLDELRKK